MPRLRRIDIDAREKVSEELSRFVRRLRRRYGPSAVYVFGSFARGELHEGSDVVVVGDFRERFFDRVAKVSELTELPMDVLVYTPEEFEEMRRSGNPLILEVLERGVAL